MSDREIKVQSAQCGKILPEFFLVESFNEKLNRLRLFVVICKCQPQGRLASAQMVPDHFVHSSLNNSHKVICSSVANRPCALARTFKVCLLTQKQEKQTTIPMPTHLQSPFAQACLLNQAKLNTSPAGNQLLLEVSNPIQNP